VMYGRQTDRVPGIPDPIRQMIGCDAVNLQQPGLQSRALLVLLIISVVINLMALSRAGDLYSEIGALRGHVTSEINRMQGEVARIRDNLRELDESMAWYSSPRLEVLDYGSDGSEMVLALEWTFSEIAGDAEVGVQYSFDDEQWREAEITALSPFSHRALLRVPVSAGAPRMSIDFSPDLSADGGRTTHVSEGIGVGSESMGSAPFSYVIYCSDGDGYRAGHPETVDISKFGGYFQGRVVESDGGRSYEASMVHRGVPPGVNLIESIDFCVACEDDELLETMRRSKIEDEWTLSLTLENERAVQKMGFIIHYLDGGSAQICMSVP